MKILLMLSALFMSNVSFAVIPVQSLHCLLTYYDTSGNPASNQEARKIWGASGTNWIEFQDLRYQYRAEMETVTKGNLYIRDLHDQDEVQFVGWIQDNTVFRLDRKTKGLIRNGLTIDHITFACIRQ